MMESWHKVGQKVALLESGFMLFHSIFGYCPFQANDVCEIAFVCLRRWNGQDRVAFELLGFPCFDWDHTHFRPVNPTSIECFRSLLTPTPEQVRELGEVDA